MSASTDFEQEMQVLIAAQDEAIERSERRIQRATDARDAALRTREALQTALAAYREYHGIPTEPESEPLDETLRRRLENLSTKQIAIALARANGGHLDAPEMCRVMVKAGIAPNIARARGNVFSMLNRDRDTFHKVGKGQYKLADTPIMPDEDDCQATLDLESSVIEPVPLRPVVQERVLVGQA